MAGAIRADGEPNDITITATKGGVTEVYTVHIKQLTILTGLQLNYENGDTLKFDPAFNKSTTEYRTKVLSDVDAVNTVSYTHLYRKNVQYLYQHNMRIPIPFFLSDHKYGILADCGSLMTFNDDSRGSYLYLDAVEQLDYYFIAGDRADEIIAGYRRLTGKAVMLPKWAYGYIQSKEAYHNQEEMVDTAREYRKRKIGLDCVVQDLSLIHIYFVACHNPSYIDKYNMVQELVDGGTFLLNCPWDAEGLDKHLPGQVKAFIANHGIKFYTIDGIKIGKEIGLGGRINTVLQSAFFALSNIIPADKANELMKAAAKATYGKKRCV